MKSDPHGTRIPSKRRATNETNQGRERSTYQGQGGLFPFLIHDGTPTWSATSSKMTIILSFAIHGGKNIETFITKATERVPVEKMAKI